MTFLEAIVAGAVGGAVSALFIKSAEYFTARFTRGDVRRESRFSDVRRMIEWLVAETHTLADACGALEFLREVSPGDVPASRDEYLDRFGAPGDKNELWRPHRILDRELRSLTEELHSIRSKLTALLILVAFQDFSEWKDSFHGCTERLSWLTEAIDARMDTLNW